MKTTINTLPKPTPCTAYENCKKIGFGACIAYIKRNVTCPIVEGKQNG